VESSPKPTSEVTPLHLGASDHQRRNRQRLGRLFRESPMDADELLVNLPLYMRASVVAKLLYVDELYRMAMQVPGVLMEFGVWRGATFTLLESLRAVHEPYADRRLIGFDTFTGYSAPAPEDGTGSLVGEGNFSVSHAYLDHLEDVLDYHRVENTLSHLDRVELVIGDASERIVEYLDRHPETVVALAYMDMQLYEPTKRCLEAIQPHLVRGSVIAMDELGSAEFPGETIAYREIFGLDKYRLTRSQFFPDRAYAIVD
jgi:hypothetical protein